MPFPGFMAIWCLSLISQRTSIKESQCLCAPLTHSPPETWSPLQLTLPERQRSRELLSTPSRKSCSVSTCTMESSCPTPRHPIPWHRVPRNAQPWTALLAQHRLWRRQLQGMAQQGIRLQKLTCLCLLILLVTTALAKQVLEPSQWCCVPASSTD